MCPSIRNADAGDSSNKKRLGPQLYNVNARPPLDKSVFPFSCNLPFLEKPSFMNTTNPSPNSSTFSPQDSRQNSLPIVGVVYRRRLASRSDSRRQRISSSRTRTSNVSSHKTRPYHTDCKIRRTLERGRGWRGISYRVP